MMNWVFNGSPLYLQALGCSPKIPYIDLPLALWNGHRSKGKPKRRWQDDLDAYKIEWQQHSLDRDEWQKEGETHAQQ